MSTQFDCLIRPSTWHAINKSAGQLAGAAVSLAELPKYAGRKAARAAAGVYGFECKGRKYVILKATGEISRELRKAGVLMTGDTLSGWVTVQWSPFAPSRWVAGGFPTIQAATDALIENLKGVRY